MSSPYEGKIMKTRKYLENKSSLQITEYVVPMTNDQGLMTNDQYPMTNIQ